jgi:hypothetical protein
MQVLDRPMRGEAAEYCDAHGLTDIDDLERVRLALCVREFRRQIEPLQSMKLAVVKAALDFQPARHVLHEDGRFEQVEQQLPPDTAALVRDLDEAIAGVARRLGLVRP